MSSKYTDPLNVLCAYLTGVALGGVAKKSFVFLLCILSLISVECLGLFLFSTETFSSVAFLYMLMVISGAGTFLNVTPIAPEYILASVAFGVLSFFYGNHSSVRNETNVWLVFFCIPLTAFFAYYMGKGPHVLDYMLTCGCICLLGFFWKINNASFASFRPKNVVLLVFMSSCLASNLVLATLSQGRNWRLVMGSFGALFKRSREKKLFLFLLLTLLVMLLEFFYGVSSNSLGLVSDSFHMLLDATSIIIGLCTAFAASWSPSKTHPFGYARYEVLGGFLNGVLLVFISMFVVVESVERILDPPEMEATYLLTVSFIGLLVNAIGVVFFHEFHTHASGECSHSHDHNMQGVYLHILADLLGSVSVIVSSLIIHFFGYVVADPVCSVVTAVLIFISAVPLLADTGKVLLLSGSDRDIYELIQKQVNAASYAEIDDIKLWNNSTAPRDLSICLVSARLKSPESNFFTVKNMIRGTTEEILSRHAGITNFCVVVHLE